MFKFIPPDTRYDFSIVMENGQALLYAANGELVEYEVAKYIADCIVNSHYPTEYIYVGRAYGDRFKVGFSNDPARRAKELGVTLVHIIPC